MYSPTKVIDNILRDTGVKNSEFFSKVVTLLNQIYMLKFKDNQYDKCTHSYQISRERKYYHGGSHGPQTPSPVPVFELSDMISADRPHPGPTGSCGPRQQASWGGWLLSPLSRHRRSTCLLQHLPKDLGDTT